MASGNASGNASANANANPVGVATASHAPAFERILEDFKKTLKKRDLENFKHTTYGDITKCIGELQETQHKTRRNQNLRRLEPFVEAIDQYGKVVAIFCNSNDFVPFIWVCWYAKLAQFELMCA